MMEQRDGQSVDMVNTGSVITIAGHEAGSTSAAANAGILAQADRRRAAEKLRDKGWSYRRIAENLGIPYILVSKWLSEEPIPAAAPAIRAAVEADPAPGGQARGRRRTPTAAEMDEAANTIETLKLQYAALEGYVQSMLKTLEEAKNDKSLAQELEQERNQLQSKVGVLTATVTRLQTEIQRLTEQGVSPGPRKAAAASDEADPFGDSDAEALSEADPFADAEADPFADTSADPFGETTDADPLADAGADPFAEAAADPFADTSTDPFAEAADADPFADAGADPFAEAVADPFAETADADPLADAGADPFADAAADPFADVSVDPFADAGTDSVAEAATDPFADTPADPFAEPADADPFAEASADPFADTGADPFADTAPASDPFADAANDPFADQPSAPAAPPSALAPKDDPFTGPSSPVKAKPPVPKAEEEEEKPPPRKTGVGRLMFWKK